MRGLTAPIDAAWLVAFRIAFGVIMASEAVRALSIGVPATLYGEPAFVFPYYGFEWLPRWSSTGMNAHYAVMAVAAALVATGWLYRGAAVVYFLAVSYVFLLDQAQYLNHYYLIVLLAFLLAVVPASGRAVVPRWTLTLFRFQIGVVYFYAGVAKLNPDWLNGQPLGIWLENRGVTDGASSIALLLSYGGLALDVLAPFLLLWRRTRVWMLAAVLGFHVANHLLFDIGVFPWLMIAATVAVYFPDWIARCRRRPTVLPDENPRPSPLLVAVVAAFVAGWMALQIAMPLRHWLYPGDVAWTEEGHKFSWRMKLRSKEGWVRFTVRERDGGRSAVVNPADHLTAEQARKMPGHPDMILTFAHWLADRYRRDGWIEPEVRAASFASLNGHPYRRLIDPAVDLAREPFALGPARWVLRSAAEGR